MTTSSTHTHHVGKQHLLGPDVEQARYDRGAQVLAAVDGESGQNVVEALADIAPALAHHVVSYGFGEVYARPGLTHAQRQLVTLGMLIALGGCEAQLEIHVNASLNVGLTPTEIVEAITHAGLLRIPQGAQRHLHRQACLRRTRSPARDRASSLNETLPGTGTIWPTGLFR